MECSTVADALATGMIVGVALCWCVIYRREIARSARVTLAELGIIKGVDDD